MILTMKTPQVFLSHTSSDKPFVRQLAADLSAAGATVWLDEAEINVGDSLIEKISDAIERAEYLVVVLSARSSASAWVQRELRAAVTEQIAGRKIKVLPVLVEKCVVPLFLRDHFYADFTTGSYADALGLLLRSIGLSPKAGLIRNLATPERLRMQLPAALVRDLTHRPDLLVLGGEMRVVTIMFTAVTGFSGVADRFTPARLVALLNEYLTGMTDVVLEHGGVVDKYLSSSLMAEFGVPMPLGDHAVHACRAALRMLDELRRLGEEWERRGMPTLRARIGISTGQVLVGNLGSFRMMDYSCMGDQVDLAWRLEGLNRVYGTAILVSEFTWREVEAHFIGREIDRVRVVGHEEPVTVYELAAVREDCMDEGTAVLMAGFTKALALYRGREFGAALAAFENLAGRYPDDGPTAEYLARCRTH